MNAMTTILLSLIYLFLTLLSYLRQIKVSGVITYKSSTLPTQIKSIRCKAVIKGCNSVRKIFQQSSKCIECAQPCTVQVSFAVLFCCIPLQIYLQCRAQSRRGFLNMYVENKSIVPGGFQHCAVVNTVQFKQG